MAKLLKSNDGMLLFECPGCGHAHGVYPKSTGNPQGGPSWDWNGSMEKPTFSPSILAQGEYRCHSYVRDGKIQYLTDCSHWLAGQTIELPEIDGDEWREEK